MYWCCYWSRDLIKKLLVQDRTKRLGNMKVLMNYILHPNPTTTGTNNDIDLAGTHLFPVAIGHGTRWLLSWFRKLAGGSQRSLRTPGRQHSCFSACPLLFNREMRSPSSARSLPPNKHSGQLFLSLIF